MRELGRERDEIRALVLNHAHFDHVGMAERLRSEWQVPSGHTLGRAEAAVTAARSAGMA